MTDTISRELRPRDVQVLPIATDTTVLRARSWTRQRFEIEYALGRGTTCNSYVIQGHKTAVIDPPPETVTDIYREALRRCLELETIDYVIIGHFNPNRMASLRFLLEIAPNLTFVTSVMGARYLRQAFANENLSVLEMRGKETLDLGKGHILKFIPTPSPRWIEALCTYDQQTQILYTDKLFSAHVCGDDIFDEDWDKYKQDQRYFYDSVMAPNAPHVKAALEKISDYPVRMYAVGNGPLIRYGLLELTKSYTEWSHSQATREIRVALLYASAYGNTATLAQAFGLGLTKAGVAVDLLNCEFATTDEIRTTLEKADGFIIGSPTIGGHAPTPIHTALGIILALADTSKPAGVFGSYGWSGEAFDLIEGKLKEAGYRLAFPTMRVRFKPSDPILKECEETAIDFAQSLKRARRQRLPQTAASPLEQAVGRIVGSVCIITAKQGDIATAMMGAWISQATFNPPGLTIAIAKDRAIESLMYAGGKLVVNILGEKNHQEYIRHFRKNFAPGEDRFAGFDTSVAANGCTIFNDAIAYLECTVNKRLECGDHWVIYAIVDDGKVLEANELTAIHYRKSGSYY
ncbi:diflavin flavoprotein [Calothrix sp. NIES-3974]|uniref:diflavin flavoprotein n=1 Tax=Calothrix sp. NIES-3974 TaxID=2005462 RepID=UPI000B6224F6|nr:diflavin flavoprotein [Calothrix sp. NIES-3974]BAZ05976.1 flavin reductase domain-containing protein [Calothrix sp. NIES-3974]